MLQAANVHPDQHMPMPDHDCYPAGASPSPLLSVDDDLENALDAELDVADPADAASQTLQHKVPCLRLPAERASF